MSSGISEGWIWRDCGEGGYRSGRRYLGGVGGVGGLRIDASRVLVSLVDYEILQYLKLEQVMDGIRF